MGEESLFLNEVVKKCHSNLLQKNSRLALAYLVSRGISFDEIKKYQIGYLGTSFDNLKSPQNEDEENFNKWLGYKGKFVAQRIIFPIYDELESIKGIETRALDQKSMSVLLPQYIHLLKDSNLFSNEIRYKKFYLNRSKYSACFFGVPYTLEDIWKEKTIFLTEGIFDCLSLLKIYPNCISSLTANLNKLQAMWLRRYAKKVILIFDMDEKGQESIEKIKNFLGKDLNLYSIPLKNKDINETILKNGVKELKLIIEDKITRFF